MPSIRAHLVARIMLPLLGIKRFFGQPERLEQRIAKLRTKPVDMPSSKMHRRFQIEEDDSAGFKVVTIEPLGGASPDAPQLLYLHGGGYVMDISAVHWEAIGKLCARLGAKVTVPLYPLAPEHKANDVIDAMLGVYRSIAAEHPASNITVMGDSAGGGLSLALAQQLASSGSAMPGRLVLFSPWADATASGEEQEAIEPHDRMLTSEGLRACGNLYRGDLALDHPKVSPLFGSLDGLPPMAIFAGSHDILVADARRLVAKLEVAGARFAYHEAEAMQHVWMLLPIPEAKAALEQTAQFIEGS